MRLSPEIRYTFIRQFKFIDFRSRIERNMARSDVKKLLWIVIGAMMVGNSNVNKKITGPADLALIVPKITDCSQLDAMKEQLPKILDHFEIGQDKIRIGVVSVDLRTHPNVVILNLTGNEADYKKFLQEWQCPTTTERKFDDYGAALANAKYMFFYQNDGRPKLVIVFFTGYSVNHNDAKKESSELTNEMGAVYVDIVDHEWKIHEPLDYTGGDASRVVNATWTEMVDSGVASLTEKIKDDLSKMTTTTTTSSTSTTTPEDTSTPPTTTTSTSTIPAGLFRAIFIKHIQNPTKRSGINQTKKF